MPHFDYRFGRYRIATASREFWRDGVPMALPRLVFDCLAYLIEHRERAVGRDELVAAVWGRPEASDGQVNQLMLRVRRTFADDTVAQGAIRTVPGFGYRWMVPIDPAEAAAPTAASDPQLRSESARSEEHAATPAPTARRKLGPWLATALVAIVCSGLVWLRPSPRPPSAPTAPIISARVLAVLPFEVSAPQDPSWIRLGVMDLAAERLRNAGFAVAPSEGVLLALRDASATTASDANDRARHAAQRLGAGAWISGTATRTERQWRIELSSAAADGVHHTATATDDDAIVAARRATDLLTAALGRAPQTSNAMERDDGLDDRLQQAQAALLAGKLETARSILLEVPPALRSEPRIRFGLAQIDVRLGHIDAGIASYTELIADAALQTDPRLHGKVLSARGSAYGKLSDFAAANRDLDAAVDVLQHADAPLDLARALNQRGVARTGLHRYDDAAADLGRARVEFQRAGDRLGLIQSDTNRGLLEAERGRAEQALPYLNQAADRFEAFGAPERAVSTLTALFDTQAAVLRWKEALATTQRQLALGERAGSPVLRYLIQIDRALALTKLGRLREAGALLDELKSAPTDDRMSTRYRHAVEAELAYADGRFDEAAAAAKRALSGWPEDEGNSRREHTVLLRQRALSLGRAPREPEPGAPSLADANKSAVSIAARAVAAALQHEARDAESLFRSALAAAGSSGVPADLALVATAYADWLLPQGRLEDVIPLAGQVAPWAERDFDCALLQLAVLRNGSRQDVWAAAIVQAQALAGERKIPAELARPLVSAP